MLHFIGICHLSVTVPDYVHRACLHVHCASETPWKDAESVAYSCSNHPHILPCFGRPNLPLLHLLRKLDIPRRNVQIHVRNILFEISKQCTFKTF
jgi:hypothetical protein